MGDVAADQFEPHRAFKSAVQNSMRVSHSTRRQRPPFGASRFQQGPVPAVNLHGLQLLQGGRAEMRDYLLFRKLPVTLQGLWRQLGGIIEPAAQPLRDRELARVDGRPVLDFGEQPGQLAL